MSTLDVVGLDWQVFKRGHMSDARHTHLEDPSSSHIALNT